MMGEFVLRKLTGRRKRPQENRRKITEYLKKHGPSDTETIRAATGMKHGSASSTLSKGCDLGIFKRVGGSRKPGWIYALGDGEPIAKPEPVARRPERLTPPSYRQMLAREQLGMESK